MNGIEILNTVYEYESLMNPIWFILAFCSVVIIAILGLCTLNYDKAQRILLRLVVVAVIGFFISVLGLEIKTDEIVDVKYQVTISEEVNFNDFMERYEILNQEGKIYTVRERD